MITALAVSAAAVLITLLIAAVQDIRSRTVYRVTWYPAFVIGLVSVVIFYVQTMPDTLILLILSLGTAALMAGFSLFGLFGKADAKALVLIALTVPVSPFAESAVPSLALSSIVNACILSMIVPAVFLIYNAVKKNKAPFLTKASGFPVNGTDILNHHGFIAEDIAEEADGTIRRTFAKQNASALRTDKAKFLRNLREHQQAYRYEISLYQRCDKLWIAVGIPFLIPLTAGFILALFGISAVDFLMILL